MSIQFLNRQGDFSLTAADETSYLYFPIGNEGGVMGSITPNLNGDSKIGQNAFLLEPVSIENLHSSNMGRNMWVKINGSIIWSIAGTSGEQQIHQFEKGREEVTVTGGKLWHLVQRRNERIGIQSDVLNYCPATKEKVEIMKVTFKNIGHQRMNLVPTVAVPIYGRSADNLRDHRHVTSLLHRIRVEEDGVVVTPTLSFNEHGHKKNEVSYGVYAREDNKHKPVGFYPILEDFIGEGGRLSWPRAVVCDDIPLCKTGTCIEGMEAMGGIRFEQIYLETEESKTYYIVLSYNGEGLKYLDEFEEGIAFQEMKDYWKKQSTIQCKTSDDTFDYFAGWVGIQPTLRRIYGCSFLPHHDYGRGGRGWRDLWQDSLALLLNDAKGVRNRLVSYYGGVRIDGSNATIIGLVPGEFIADRNSIVRVWMDHGLWPLITTNLYIHQTGDGDILFEENTYFKDSISNRGEGRDGLWDGQTSQLRTYSNEIYNGTILEHILVQHLTAFYDVGEHNHMKLKGGDWNDALDMAKENGESVAFTAAYAGNLATLSELLTWILEKKNIVEVEIAEELVTLLFQSESVYSSPLEKRKVLEHYCNLCTSYISGKKAKIKVVDLISKLNGKSEWIKKHIRSLEYIADEEGNHWFNGYYDNHKEQVEGVYKDKARVLLTSQVFTIMSKTATDEQVSKIVNTMDYYLYDISVGGYRLNTNFEEVKTDLGRMFGFAYGNKENGSVFSHMAVMYAYSLYSRRFVTEGYKVLKSLYLHAMDFKVSRMYPGIPEYFNKRGRGMYHYLTGSASWFMLTMLTQMYGVRGEYGDLVLDPKLVAEQFDEQGSTSIQTFFADKNITVLYVNKNLKEIGDYEIDEIYLDNKLYTTSEETAKISRKDIIELEEGREHTIRVILS
ncbi:glycosyl hydrolase family 36 [Mobilisporobacter senegalensis]|uniref:Glycosyl hydrolase family 36 n=1 Tax=Mobilisporobacter senegalensis TaxID=1329262 RepID=A0A3N1XUX8_9FIRM|nr:cellobiose phosphorylase [Mobilisporobacter senegalensis]ROR30420.1 glycosyl hydrolase family 36 [Mobilisporobacter senegalensis]